MPLGTGTILSSRYRIVKLLGQGGFGAVYKAWDLNLERPVAVKENLDPGSQAAAQFKREAKMLADLSNPHLARVTDYFSVGPQNYLVMDFIDGEDLQTILEQAGRQPEERVLGWFQQVADALIYLHTQTPPIIHRDIKPANIRVKPNGQTYLVDFGIAKQYDPRMVTTQGARAVTPPFSPIEQYGQGGTDARTDIYALGATLYLLLTGQAPPESVARVSGEALIPPRTLVPQLSVRTEAAVLRAMELIQTKRFQTMAEFAAALNGLQPAPAQVRTPAPAQAPIPMPAPASASSPAPSAVTPQPNPAVEKDKMVMIYVPAGPFMMGSLDSDSQANADEKPQHSIYLDGYWIDKTPVTNAMFMDFVQATGYQTEAELARGVSWRHPRGQASLIGRMDHPVVNVTWNDAQAYCAWVGRRLPSEAEWEKAARGMDGRIYPWGSHMPERHLGNFNWQVGDITPVGRSSPQGDSPYGCMDMAGNVFEWVADYYDQDYYRTAPHHNPKGPTSGENRIARGGSWDFLVWYARCAARLLAPPNERTNNIGFRCAR